MVNPPERVLHHAILYRDGIATLAPDDPLAYLDERVRCAHEAGLYRPLPTGSLWRDSFGMLDWPRCEVDRDDVRELVLRGEFVPRWGQFYDNWGDKPLKKIWDSRERGGGDQATALRNTSMIRVGFVESLWDHLCDGHGYHYYPVTCSGSGPMADIECAVMVRTATVLSELENESGTAPMFVPCFGPELSDADKWIRNEGRDDVVLNVDVGRILPDPLPGIDTAVLIKFRQKYDEERRRLIVAVERLVEQLAQTYSEPRHIECAIRREINEALADMRSAGRRVLLGWSKRLFAVAVATGSTATTLAASGASPVLAVMGSVGAGIAVNKASEPIPDGLCDPRSGAYRYLHRISVAQA